MTEDELKAIEERANAATKGTWILGSWGDNVFSVAGGNWTEICRIKRDDKAIEESQDGRDAAFIAHAHEDVPALVAEVRRLRARLETVLSEGDDT